ncbi:MAG: translation initiation factor IF-3 [Elusimicrobiota bacterium]
MAFDKRYRVNNQIRVPQVRVISADGNMIGIKSTYEAINLARAAGLDLVEISPNSNPPVCKIIDYHKFLYEEEKKEKENRKKQKENILKEIRVNPRIAQHDLETKIRHMEEFLKKNHRVRVALMFHGRELQHKEIGENLLNQIQEKLSNVGEIDGKVNDTGNKIIITLKPKKA